MKVLMLGSLSYSLINFRGQLLKALREAGHDVVGCAPDRDEAIVEALAEMGVAFRTVPMDRAGLNPLRDLATLCAYFVLLHREKPDVVIAYTQKPIIYGGMATRLFGRARFYVLMSGLGHVFSADADERRLLRRLVSGAYRVAVRKAGAIFVFNGDDRRMMMTHGIIREDQHVVQVGGSGIDTSHFAAAPLPPGPPIFLMIARLMRDKGVGIYLDAANIVKQRYPDVRFRLLGRFETDNPTGYTQRECEEWAASGLIEHLPETRDVRPHLAAAHVFVLPSFYREGLPRTLLEALAIGRPIITTDMPGCREPVQPGQNGWLVPPRDAVALADAMFDALSDFARLKTMAKSSRALAVERYDVKRVNACLLDCMHLDRDATHSADVFRGARSISARSGSIRAGGLVGPATAALALLMLAPLILAIAAVTRISLGRPILFRQRRVGIGGATFEMIKFRTMREVCDADGVDLPDEARVSSLGRFLRRSRLDELPGLWHIVRGDMNWVGPRPLLPATIEDFDTLGELRSAVRPGLTGWAQINGNSFLKCHEKLLLDLWYIENRSVGLDLQILLRTAQVILAGERVNAANLEKAVARSPRRSG
ncbi:MAG: glycosyl transferase [Sphingomonadales bacterium]|nr:glycosyl transferase [Sphingomonadales bacterium]